ncbi:Hypp4532 [Branchiostoma lanceolatum]|uniref:Hypp4532 protein n=1 Tax=Branchiostoma lanceolatum TaxID=7740 RepID=A0A8K0A987_BRALA|nr:Hypp4532 [Branchiostoma lanceolatum]
MDSRVGACWRCGGPCGTKCIKCAGCEFAVYCSQACQNRDKFRHEVECINCAVRHTCSACSRVSRIAKRCSSCDKAWYCNQTCQRDDWKRHKSTCHEIQERIVQAATSLRQAYSLNRSLQRLGGFPYYWGNTLAKDLIKIEQNEGEYPGIMAVLLAGVGNLRNVMATVAGLKPSYKGNILFALNDSDPQVTARNVFFLHFLWKYKDDEGISRKLTQIWYSVKIGEEDAIMAEVCLRELLSLPDDTGTLCDGTITMAAEQVAQIRPVFQLWLSLLTGERTLQMTPQEQLRRTYQLNADGVDKIMWSIPTRHRASADDWFKTGILLPQSDPRRKCARRDNFTLAAWNHAHGMGLSSLVVFPACSDEVGEIAPAGINDDGMPFAEWDYLQVKETSRSDNLLILYSRYIEDIVRRFTDMFKQGRLIFQVILSDCLSLAKHLPGNIRFDRIFTSNLADYVSYPVLLDTYRPLVRKDNNKSVIITEFLNMGLYFPEVTATDIGPFLLIPLLKDATEDLRHEPDWTGRDLTNMVYNTGATSIIEYFDTWGSFTQYLRAALFAHKCPASSHPVLKRKDVPKMSEVNNSCGMKMRNFLRELNTVWPFRHRVNVRRVSLLNGHERVLEWALQDSAGHCTDG